MRRAGRVREDVRLMNRRGFRWAVVTLPVLALASAMILGSVSGPGQDHPFRGPVNQDFLAWLEALRAGKAVDRTEEGHGLGDIPPLRDPSPVRPGRIFAVREALPLAYDLRTLSKVTPVRDQGSCGSCWAFAALGSLESYLMPDRSWDFSEQNMIDHHGYDWGPCEGGNADIAAAYLVRWSGPLDETDDPYVYAADFAGGPRQHVQDVVFLPSRTGALDNGQIKQAVMAHGGAYVSMYYGSAFYNSGYAAYYRPSGTNTNHGVLVVGWDDNFDRTRFNTPAPGDGAFLCKNSWGTSWGQAGFFHISYYDTAFQPRAAFTGESLDHYAGLYLYDPLGWVMSYGYGSNAAWGANIFTAASSDPLSAVGIVGTSPGAGYAISVYTGVAPGQPVSGTLRASATGALPAAGYYTIPFDAPVPLSAGQSFSIVVRFETPGYLYPLPAEEIYPGYSSGASASSGQSFWSPNGSSWSDASARSERTNICIKGFTQTAAAAPIVSGHVRTPDGAALADVLMAGLPLNPVTPASGAYAETVPSGWSGSVTPAKSGYTFSPAWRSYENILGNQPAQDFTAATGGCTYDVSPTVLPAPKTGGGGAVNVTSPGGCAWSAASGVGWISITSGASGSGNGVVEFSVASNAGGRARTGTLVAAGRTVTVHQEGEIGFNEPFGHVILPECLWAEATGGGTWMSEVQVTDLTGGSQVSAYFSAGGIRRGPVAIWNNSGGPKRSVKFSNMLAFLAAADTGFTYYGRVGAVEFLTQDADHVIQAAARTLNGHHSKTFPGLIPLAENTAAPGRSTVILDLANNADRRPACGFFNPTTAAITAAFTLRDETGAIIGTPFSRSFGAYAFLSFNPFTEAGRAYPDWTYTGAHLMIAITSGSGGLIGFGAAADNLTNDPAAHLVLQAGGTMANSPGPAVILPECIWAPATGGGTWLSEVQITDMTGGSIVSAWFSPGGGVRRGPVTVFSNAGGAPGTGIRFDNFLSSLAAADSGYAYSGKVGAVEFTTQDAAHAIHVSARTRNGRYSKTFPGQRPDGPNLADISRTVIIQNLASGAAYRSTCGVYNVTDAAVQAEFRLLDGSGAVVGAPFARTIGGRDFQAFDPFLQAGVPYPAQSFDNVILLVRPFAGSGALLCFGASADNVSNDPAAHFALQSR